MRVHLTHAPCHNITLTCEHIAAGAHGAADEHGLPGELVVHGDQGVVRRERARGALAVHQQLHLPPVDHVLLHLRMGFVGLR